MTSDQVKKRIEDEGIEYFLCSFVEMSGAPKAKLVPATNFDEMSQEGAGFAGFAAGHIGQGPHDTDMMNIPDLDSLTVLPWRKNVAWLAGNIHVSGGAWPYCPRTILLRQLEKARLEGYTFNVGVEPEFMLLKENDSGRFEPWDRYDTLKKPCYDLRALHRNLDLMTTIIGYMQEMSWGPLCQRSRRRQLPVRDQLALQRRINHRRPQHVLQVDGSHRCREKRVVGDADAEALRPSHRQWHSLPHEPGRCDER